MEPTVQVALITASGTIICALIGARGYRIQEKRRRQDESEYLEGIGELRAEVRDLARSLRPPLAPRAVDEDA